MHERLVSNLEDMLQLFGAPGLSAKEVLEHALGLSTDPIPLLGSSFENRNYDTSDPGKMSISCGKLDRWLLTFSGSFSVNQPLSLPIPIPWSLKI